jgi:hypothetical protein
VEFGRNPHLGSAVGAQPGNLSREFLLDNAGGTFHGRRWICSINVGVGDVMGIWDRVEEGLWWNLNWFLQEIPPPRRPLEAYAAVWLAESGLWIKPSPNCAGVSTLQCDSTRRDLA